MKKSVTFSESEVRSLLDESKAAASVAAAGPSWKDVESAFGVEAKTTDGETAVDVPLDTRTEAGRRNAEKFMEMMSPAWRVQGERASTLRGRQKRSLMRDAEGRERMVLPEHEDTVGRRFGLSRKSFMVGAGLVGSQYRCEHGHTFSFLPRTDRARTKPCVRDGCDGTGVLENA